MPTSSLPVAAISNAPLSPVAGRLLRHAQAELEGGQPEAAERTLASVLALAPGNVEALRRMGLAAQRRGDHGKAAACFRQVVAVWPNDAALQVGLGAALFAAGAVEEGISHLETACGLVPDSASAWLNLGEALRQSGQVARALDAMARAVGLDTESIPLRLSFANACAGAGQGDAAVREFREVLRRDPTDARAWFGLSNLNACKFDSADVECLRPLFAQAADGAAERISLGFALAKALEDKGDYAEAFDVFRLVNSARRKQMGWDAADHRGHVQAIQQAFADWTPPRPPAPDMGDAVILLAGIPRSGATLVEQMLASHPEVEGADEIQDLPDVVDAESQRRNKNFPGWISDATADDWQRLGSGYLRRTARWRVRRPRFTDKNLANWHLAGGAFAMLPAARLVIVRRDPVETCLACYRQLLAGDSGFTCDLDDMADYCVDFMRLTRFWLAKFPDRVFDLEYEALVDEPESTIRRLLDFCGLPFDRSCLEYHRTGRTVMSAPSAVQVRQPLRRDTARADRYGHRLDSLRQRLLDAGL